jgi:hypothetical protein
MNDDLELWVAPIHEARDYDALDRAQASWARTVSNRGRRTHRERAEALASIASIGRARWEELTDYYAWIRAARAERQSSRLEFGPSSTDLA